jgi:hypothetical protein
MELVGTLKEAIKEKKKPMFDLVPADTIGLCKARGNPARIADYADQSNRFRNLYPLTASRLLPSA